MLCATVAGLQLVGTTLALLGFSTTVEEIVEKKQNFHLRKPVTVFFTVFYHDNGYRPIGTV